jgi:hypothetical protein
VLKKQPKSKATVQSMQPQPASNPVVASAPQPPLSLLQEPAQHAQVRLSSQGLFIQAENANLSQILKEIAGDTGMKLEGLGKDQRIFGNYGPGVAREVLSQLLEGTGYNVLMVGETEQGTPRELVLTPRTTSTSTTATSSAPARNADADEEAAEPEDVPPQPQTPPPQPVGQQQSPNGNGVKTPQQLLEELRRLRDQNQNPDQQQQQQQNSPSQVPQ